MQLNKYDLVISDLAFTNCSFEDGFSFIKYLKSRNENIKAIALTHYNSYKIMHKAIESGYDSFINKGCPQKAFSDTVINVLKNGRFVSSSEKQIKGERKNNLSNIYRNSVEGIFELTPREIDLLQHCVKTIKRAELAKIMNVKPYTVDTHFKNIRSKLQLNSIQYLHLYITR